MDPKADINIGRWSGWAGLVVVIGTVMRTPIIVLMGVLVFLMGLLLRLWWDNALRNLRYERQFSSARAFHGDQVTIEMVAQNAKPLPVTRLDVDEEVSNLVRIQDHDLMRSADTHNFIFQSLFSLGMYERVAHRYTLDCHRRGWHLFGPTTLTARDPFGITSRRQVLAGQTGVLVYPRIVPVTTFIIPARQPIGDFKPAMPIVEDPMRVIGVRPYAPGDSPRRIHWRATARTGELQTRIFEPSANPVAAIFLDTISFSHLWEGQQSQYLEMSIVIAASLAKQLIDGRQAVGLYANAPVKYGARSVRILPGRSGGQLTRILENLAALQPAFGDRIEDMLSKEIHSLPFGASVVVLSRNVTPKLQRSLLRLARAGGARRFVIVCLGEQPDLFHEIRKRFAVYHVDSEEAWDAIEAVQLTRIA